jgi:hypothetical protein
VGPSDTGGEGESTGGNVGPSDTGGEGSGAGVSLSLFLPLFLLLLFFLLLLLDEDEEDGAIDDGDLDEEDLLLFSLFFDFSDFECLDDFFSDLPDPGEGAGEIVGEKGAKEIVGDMLSSSLLLDLLLLDLDSLPLLDFSFFPLDDDFDSFLLFFKTL